MGAKVREYKLGDLVENISYIRKPRLKGIIIKCLGFDKELDDFIYKIYCYNTGKLEFWAHHGIKKI
tara:strand:- start:2407 stop:2604 length:198 start_codon:yes stop_codon:yes gene_type:complete